MFLYLFRVRLRSHPSEYEWQEHEAIENTKHDDEKIHSEIVELEKCGRSESENNNTNKLGRSDSDKN